MSEEIAIIETKKGAVQITSFYGGQLNGEMIQVSQGLAGSNIGIEGDMGMVQLSPIEAMQLVKALTEWVKVHSKKKAEWLIEQIEKDTLLKNTFFEDAAKCQQFIDQLEVPTVAVTMLQRIKVPDSDAMIKAR
jgi:hypothetical protein